MKIIKILLILLVIAIPVFYFIHKPKTGIYNYKEKRDKQTILDIFKEDIYWLSANPNFSAEPMLKNMASDVNDPSTYGNLIIKVFLENYNTAGFIAYHKLNVNTGYILFLDINSKYRKKGYAEKLIEYTCKDMKNKGFTKVRLVTRVVNEPAIALYKKMGFSIINQDDTFVYFEKKLS